jgi:hypothetical protein
VNPSPELAVLTPRFDLAFTMNKRKVLIVNLAKGIIGEQAANLLGSLIVSHMQLIAMERAALPARKRVPFFVHVDEFQTFSSDAFASLLSEARKFATYFCFANQYTDQLSPAVRSAVIGNAGTLIVFRIGSRDAELLAPEFHVGSLDAGLMYAPEHRAIVPGDLVSEAERVFGRIEAAIEPVVPDGEVWELSLPALGLQRKSGREVRQAQDALIEHIKNTAPTLQRRPFADYRKAPPPEKIANVPCPVSLYRFHSEVPADVPGFKRLIIKHDVEGNRVAREAQLQKRIERACSTKRFDKLAVWKEQAGACTVLILENLDKFITDTDAVANAYLAIAASRSNKPDEAYLFDTSISAVWFLWPLQIYEQTYFDINGDMQPLLGRFRPSELASATKRYSDPPVFMSRFRPGGFSKVFDLLPLSCLAVLCRLLAA